MNQGEFKIGCFLGDGVCPRNALTVTSLYFGECDAVRGLIDGAFDPDLVVGDGFRVTARAEGQDYWAKRTAVMCVCAHGQAAGRR